jgi:hypothetical protein
VLDPAVLGQKHEHARAVGLVRAAMDQRAVDQPVRPEVAVPTYGSRCPRCGGFELVRPTSPCATRPSPDLHFSQSDGEIMFCGAIEMGGLIDFHVDLIRGGMETYGVTTNPILMPGTSSRGARSS